jgi:hypothetical protein
MLLATAWGARGCRPLENWRQQQQQGRITGVLCLPLPLWHHLRRQRRGQQLWRLSLGCGQGVSLRVVGLRAVHPVGA